MPQSQVHTASTTFLSELLDWYWCVFGLLLGVFALVFGMSANLTNLGNLKFFLEPTSFALVFVPIVGTLLIGCRGYFISSVTSIWKRDVDNQTLDRSIQFWKAAKRYAIAYGFIGTMIGVITLLTHGGLENLGTLGPSLQLP